MVTSERFKIQRDIGGQDWSVIDTRAKNIPVASGLDFSEAQQAAEARNKKRGKKKSRQVGERPAAPCFTFSDCDEGIKIVFHDKEQRA
jgi:hypothetical protein